MTSSQLRFPSPRSDLGCWGPGPSGRAYALMGVLYCLWAQALLMTSPRTHPYCDPCGFFLLLQEFLTVLENIPQSHFASQQPALRGVPIPLLRTADFVLLCSMRRCVCGGREWGKGGQKYSFCWFLTFYAISFSLSLSHTHTHTHNANTQLGPPEPDHRTQSTSGGAAGGGMLSAGPEAQRRHRLFCSLPATHLAAHRILCSGVNSPPHLSSAA